MTYFLHPHVVFSGNESNHSHQQEQFFPLVYFISIFGTPGKKRFFWGFRTQKIDNAHEEGKLLSRTMEVTTRSLPNERTHFREILEDWMNICCFTSKCSFILPCH